LIQQTEQSHETRLQGQKEIDEIKTLMNERQQAYIQKLEKIQAQLDSTIAQADMKVYHVEQVCNIEVLKCKVVFYHLVAISFLKITWQIYSRCRM
jgi:hypothetical protein